MSCLPRYLSSQAECSYETFRDSALTDCPMTHGGHSLIARGLYALQLQPWMETFPGQIKVLSLSDIKGSADKVGAGVCMGGRCESSGSGGRSTVCLSGSDPS